MEHSHPPLLPVVRERAGGREDHADVRGTEFLREEMRFGPADNGEFE